MIRSAGTTDAKHAADSGGRRQADCAGVESKMRHDIGMTTAIPATNTKPMRAGGRATEAGMAFQAAVATWFAVHILVRLPVGGRFGVNNAALPTAVRLETGTALDDIEVTQSDGGALHIQSKTSANLATGERAPLAKTGGQLATWMANAKASGGAPDPTRTAAMLAVKSDAARTLDDLEAGCRAFDLGGSWAVTKNQRNAAQRSALGKLETIVTAAWTTHRGVPPSDGDLADMARSFHIARFSMDEGDADWREASRLLGRHLYGGDAAGDAPLRDLRGIMRDLVGNAAPADRIGLLNRLRSRGHVDTGAPRFEEDLARLQDATNAELARLAAHGRLPVSGGVTITRESDAPMAAAIACGSLLVVGEPGAGKTGALVHAATMLAAGGAFVVFLSVDRFPGVAIAANLASELQLGHPLVEVLAAVPGSGPKYLLIDALDAARGGPAEGVFASLIEQVRCELADEWVVVASIRTFDLRNGQRYRQSFAGAPADFAHADASLEAVRHFLVPRLTDVDLATARASSPEIADLLAATTPPLHELLRNVFNLSLAAKLMADGVDPVQFAGIRTQSGLIDTYEDSRMPTTGMTQAVADAAAAMASSRRLYVRKVDVRHPDLDQVIQSGVLTVAGEFVRFAHHVLFDHVAGRYHLAWHDPDRLIAQLEGDTSAALMLAPALRFAVERNWRVYNDERYHSWRLICGIFSSTKVDALLGNVALRIVCENVGNFEDLSGLVAWLQNNPDDPAIVKLLERLSRLVEIDIEAARGVMNDRAITWANLAELLARSGCLPLVGSAHVLLQVLFNHANLTDMALLAIFGRAARAMLEFGWSKSPPLQMAGPAIRFVGRSFASDPTASRTLLDRILREPHFSQNADREAHWLTGQILPIARTDPAFAKEIYAGIYAQMITDTATSALGGHRSRILSLSSSRRQDYEQSRRQLGMSIGEFLTISPEHGTRAVIDAVIGKSRTQGFGEPKDPEVVDLGLGNIKFRGSGIELNAWYEQGDGGSSPNDDVLAHYVTFLRSCDDASFGASVAAASREYATATVWKRILGVASERVAQVGNLIWPTMNKPDLLANADTLRDAVRFIVAAWPTRSHEERRAFEEMMLDDTRHDDGDARLRWRLIFGRLLALIPEENLALESTRDLRRQMQVGGELMDNRPSHSFTSVLCEHEDYVRGKLRREGVDLDGGPDQTVLDASDALNASVHSTPSASDAPKLATLWTEAMELLALIDANSGLHEQVDLSAWGHVSKAVERVVSSPSFAPGADGLPDLDTMLAVLARLSGRQNMSIAWGPWDVRVYATKAWVALAPRFATERPEIVDRINECIADQQPAVRLQVARNLQVICVAAPERMWEIGERLATAETDAKVLNAYLGRPLLMFSHAEPERCERILAIAKGRLGGFADDAGGQDHIQECLGGWVAQLQARQGRPLASAWLDEWAADPERFQHALNAYTSTLREAFFGRYAADAEQGDREINDRAQEGLSKILGSTFDISSKTHAVLVSDAPDDEKHAAGREYSAAERVINHAMNQLYFGSGALKEDTDDGSGLNVAGTKARFLVDYADILGLLQRSREPATQHQLIELYEHLIPGDPVTAFMAIHVILTGPGAEEGYQFETLGSSAVVKVVKRYIADHRSIFEDPERRTELVEILQLFSEIGWSDAIRLLYELPDLLR